MFHSRFLAIGAVCAGLGAQVPHPGAMAQQQAFRMQMEMRQQLSIQASMRRAQEERRRAIQKRQLKAEAQNAQAVDSPLPLPTREAWTGPKASTDFFPLLCGDKLVICGRDGDKVVGVNTADGKVQWECPVPFGLEVNPLPVGDEVVLVDKAFEAFVLEPSTGKTGKAISIQGGDLFPAPGGKHPETLLPALSNRILVLAIRGMKKPETPGALVAIDMEAGKRIWMAPLSERPDLDPLISGDAVITGGEGKLRAFNISDGKAAWTADLGNTDPIQGGAVLEGDRLAVCAGGDLFAFDAKTGKQAWKRAFRGEPILIPLGDRLFCLEQRGKILSSTWLVALNVSDGSKAWDSEANEGSTPWISIEGVVLSLKDDLKGLDASTGKALWSSPIGGDHLQLPMQGDGHQLYTTRFLNNKFRVESRDLNTGKIVWSYPVEENLSLSGILLIGPDALYFPATRGRLVCLR